MKDKVEALLFSLGKKVKLQELSELTGIKDLSILKEAIAQLKKEYEKKDTALKLIEEPDGYKLYVKEEHLPLLQKVVTQAELSKTLMETLAVIAWKYPCLQAEVIKIRTNKAYDHLKELEEMGFISREPFGRTRKIKLTEHFFEYFDLPTSEAKIAFKSQMSEDIREKINKMESHINTRETAIEEAKKAIKEQEEIFKQKKDKEAVSKLTEAEEKTLSEEQEILENLGE